MIKSQRILLRTLCLFIAIIFCHYTSDGQVRLLEGLVGYYPLNGDAHDYSGNCNHGQVYGASATNGLDGTFLSAMSFDGQDDYIEIPHSELVDFSNEDDFAISFWVQMQENQSDVDTSDNDIISKWVIDDYSMRHEKEGYPFVFRVINQKRRQNHQLYAAQYGGLNTSCKGSTSLQTKIIPSTSIFHHILLNVENGKLYLYINGELKRRRGSNVFCNAQNKAPIRLGKRGGSKFQNHFAGSIDELAFYNRALNKEEITILSDKKTQLIKALEFATSANTLVYSDTLFFDDDVFNLTNVQRLELGHITKFLEVGTQYHLIIHGHTNGIPSDDFCDVLSLKRAQVVQKYMYDLGISCHKITTKAHGKRQQISPNSTPILRKRNQRVEVELYKISKV